MCLARYKTRPGLTYHYNHSHKDRDMDSYHAPEPEDSEARSVDSPSAGSDSLDAPLVPRVALAGRIQGFTLHTKETIHYKYSFFATYPILLV